jgi:pimeloyl-ACP methyl ester carboxylesterase
MLAQHPRLAAPWTTPAAALISVLAFLSFVPLGHATSPPAKEISVNGVTLNYVEQGTGEPVVFVHGAVSDMRVWEPLRDEIAKKHRFIAYTQRYFGAGSWPDDGKKFSVATHADDLAGFIRSLNAGSVHLVGWSYGGTVALVVATKDPSLVRSLVLYEAAAASVLPPDSAEARQAAADRARTTGPAVNATKAGDPQKGVQLLIEGVFQLPPGGASQAADTWQTIWRDNARTLPVMFAAPPPPPTPCDTLKLLSKPTLVVSGEKTAGFFPIIDASLVKCIPGAQRAVLPHVNHDAPARDPAAFSRVILDFLSKHPGSRG